MSNTLVIVEIHKTKVVSTIVPEFVSNMKHIKHFAILTFIEASVMSEERVLVKYCIYVILCNF